MPTAITINTVRLPITRPSGRAPLKLFMPLSETFWTNDWNNKSRIRYPSRESCDPNNTNLYQNRSILHSYSMYGSDMYTEYQNTRPNMHFANPKAFMAANIKNQLPLHTAKMQTLMAQLQIINYTSNNFWTNSIWRQSSKICILQLNLHFISWHCIVIYLRYI